MPVAVTLLYPAVEFDVDYYVNSHMKLVEEKWGKLGLKSWSVVKLDPSTGHAVQATLIWDSLEAFQAASGAADGAAIRADVPNYTKGKPVALVGEIVGAS